MRKAKSGPSLAVHKIISRRIFCETGLAALSAELIPGMTFAYFEDSTATQLNTPELPTLDEMGTGWLDCSLLAQMPSLHNFHNMAACAPDLIGVNILPGGELYGGESGPRWLIYNSLPLCGLTINARSYNCTSCRWFAYQAERRTQVGDLDVVTTNRLVIEDRVVLWRVKITNSGATSKTFDVALTADTNVAVPFLQRTRRSLRRRVCAGARVLWSKAAGPRRAGPHRTASELYA